MKYLPDILKVVCEHYRVKEAEVRSSCRAERLSVPRQMFMFLAYRDHYTLSDIGSILNNRHHTTILHGVQSVRSQIGALPDVSENFAILCEKLRQLPNCPEALMSDRQVRTLADRWRPARVATKGYVTL